MSVTNHAVQKLQALDTVYLSPPSFENPDDVINEEAKNQSKLNFLKKLTD